MVGRHQRVSYYPIPMKNWAWSNHRALIHKLIHHKNQVLNNREVSQTMQKKTIKKAQILVW